MIRKKCKLGKRGKDTLANLIQLFRDAQKKVNRFKSLGEKQKQKSFSLIEESSLYSQKESSICSLIIFRSQYLKESKTRIHKNSIENSWRSVRMTEVFLLVAANKTISVHTNPSRLTHSIRTQCPPQMSPFFGRLFKPHRFCFSSVSEKVNFEWPSRLV